MPRARTFTSATWATAAIRKIDLEAGTIATVAGNGKRGVPTDGTTATEAPLVDPRAVAVDKAGRLWILERAGHALRVVEDGKIRTVAGTGEKGFAGDGGPALKAKLDGPKFLWIDPAGDVLIADTENHCIRKFARQDGTITRVAGTGKKGMDAQAAGHEVRAGAAAWRGHRTRWGDVRRGQYEWSGAEDCEVNGERPRVSRPTNRLTRGTI